MEIIKKMPNSAWGALLVNHDNELWVAKPYKVERNGVMVDCTERRKKQVFVEKVKKLLGFFSFNIVEIEEDGMKYQLIRYMPNLKKPSEYNISQTICFDIVIGNKDRHINNMFEAGDTLILIDEEFAFNKHFKSGKSPLLKHNLTRGQVLENTKELRNKIDKLIFDRNEWLELLNPEPHEEDWVVESWFNASDIENTIKSMKECLNEK